ncbi:MAG: EscU/YscU/HrcU family type III secretion system export apparatus switch protein [Verrucomicrobium sp.]|nr:EscU/YscU/HrcU family type III secretion system export apparatus switch protein [Verrucomicrobium sp.]
MPQDDLKNLPASAKKRAKLRESGMVVRSHDLATTVIVATGLFSLMYFGSQIGIGLADFMRECFTELGKPAGHTSATTPLYPMLSNHLLLVLILFMGGMALVAVLANMVQSGPLWIADKLLEQGRGRLNPLKGIKNLFSLRKLVATSQSVIKLLLIASFAYAAVRELSEAPVFSRPVSVQELGAFFLQACWAVGWRVILALLILGVIDYLYQRWQYEKDNRMSFQDVKDEVKQSEGSPEIRARRRGIMRRMRSLRRQLEDMADATIVVNNPTHYSVALRYVRGLTPTPIVVAKGTRRNALRIRERAADLGIPMLENVPLAQGLYKHGEVGEPIPPLYYQAVAQVLADLFRRGYRPTSGEGQGSPN